MKEWFYDNFDGIGLAVFIVALIFITGVMWGLYRKSETDRINSQQVTELVKSGKNPTQARCAIYGGDECIKKSSIDTAN